MIGALPRDREGDMDIFAYTTLGVFGVLLLAWGLAVAIAMLREPLGRSILLGLASLVFGVCVVVSAVWLIGTRLI